MSMGVRDARAAVLAAAILCLLAVGPPTAQATYPGKPGVIVFNHIPTLDDDDNYVGGLYAISPDSKRPRQLTDNPWDDEASFAPSGQRLVFARTMTYDRGIYALDLRSGQTRRLTRSRTDHGPAFGTRGRVVFSRHSLQSGSYDLFLRTSAGRLRRLTSTPADDMDPVFTPDGSRILFTQIDKAPSSEPLPPRKISLIRVDGGGLRDIQGLEEASYVDISPDGRNLVFEKSELLPGGGVDGKIWTRRFGGGEPKLAAEDGVFPTYSPSGEKIAYTRLRELWLLNLGGGGAPRLLSDWDAVSFHLDGKLTTEAAWQPLPIRR